MVPHLPFSTAGIRKQVAAGVGILVLVLGIVYLWRPPDASDSSVSPAPAGDRVPSAAVFSGSPSASIVAPPAGRAKPKASPPASGDDGQPFTKSKQYSAALAVAGMEEDGSRVEAIEALLETWVATNPRQAADWAGSLPAGAFRDDVLSSLMVHWAARSAPDAAAWMTRTGVDDGEAASVLASSWATKDPAAAAAWAGSLGNEDSRRLATSSAAAAWAGIAPQSAAAYAESLPPGERLSAITAVMGIWAGTAPSEAGAWLNRAAFASENDRAIAMAALVTTWTARSPSSVSKFVNALPEGPAREAAASQFAVTAAATAPAEALMWAMNLRDADQRNQVVADACENWFEGSPETFREGIGEAISLMDDPLMRRGIYEMLFERDPAFHDSLLQLADPANILQTAAAPAPAAAREPAPPLPPDPTLLFPPPLPEP